MMANHFEKWLSNHQSAVVNMLPGRFWILEKKIAKTVRALRKRITLNCFERVPKVMWESVPWQRNPAYVDLNCYAGKYADFSYPKQGPAFSWADYCGTPKATEIAAFTKAIRKGDIVYVTFYLIPRFRESIDEDCAPALSGPMPKRAERLACVLESIIKKKIGDNFTRILFSSYINGEGKRGASPMVTVGWHFKKGSALA